MVKKARYIEIQTLEEKRNSEYKVSLERYSISRKINKSTNLELLDLIINDEKVSKYLNSELFRTNPSYEFWIRFNNIQNTNKEVINYLRILLTISDNFSERFQNLGGLIHIIEYKDYFLRSIESWTCKSRNAGLQYSSLVKHLFTKYKTPVFLEKSFEQGDFEGIYMYLHLGSGKSMKNYGGYPVNMIIHNKAAHHLYTTPEDMDFYMALRRIQVLYMGGDDYIFKALMRSNILNQKISVSRIRINGEKEFKVDFSKEEFWLSVMKFFIDNTMIEPQKISEIIDYIHNCKYKTGYVNGRTTPPEHPNFSMKGRNPATLIELSDEWHYQQARIQRVNQQLNRGSRSLSDFSWKGITISDYSFKRGKNKVYKVIQLNSFFQLRDEGNYMHHCVASYAQQCNLGNCSIFSVREYVGDVYVDTGATIEVRGTNIVQVRGKYNRKPDDIVIKVIKEWSDNTRFNFKEYSL